MYRVVKQNANESETIVEEISDEPLRVRDLRKYIRDLPKGWKLKVQMYYTYKTETTTIKGFWIFKRERNISFYTEEVVDVCEVEK